MSKKFVSIILLIIIGLMLTTNIFAEEELDIKAKSAILMDYYTGEVIYERILMINYLLLALVK